MGRPKNRDEYRKELAEGFVKALEEKGLSWKKEWKGHGGLAPHNGVTKANYRGCNAFWLSVVSAMKGYDDPRWVTMVQIMDKKGIYHPKEKWHLKAGSKATYVEYFYPYDRKEKKALTWDQYKELLKDGRKPEEFLLSSRYTAVFNASLVEGMPELEVEHDRNPEVEADRIVGRIASGMQVPILNDGGDRAYYSPSEDCIHLPTPESFATTYAYNATALHELCHSSGSESRLNRNIQNFFGSEPYAYEELVAEIGSSFLGFHLQAEPSEAHIQNHQAYVQSWIQEIREKPDTLMHAIKDAQAAANYMEWKGGLLTEKEYQQLRGETFTVPENRIREAAVSKDRPENALKNAEMAVEDDYNMIDGIINNGPKESIKEQLESAKVLCANQPVKEKANHTRTMEDRDL